jgi:hypothetical protein
MSGSRDVAHYVQDIERKRGSGDNTYYCDTSRPFLTQEALNLAVALNGNAMTTKLHGRSSTYGPTNPIQEDAWGALLHSNTTLTKLTLKGYVLDEDGFASSLETNTTLTSLNISGGKLGTSVVKSLRVNTVLHELILHDGCDITDDGIHALARTLAINSTLTRVAVTVEKHANPMLAQFANALSHNTSLRSLSLRSLSDSGYQCIDAESDEVLGTVLEKNSTLTSLYISGTFTGIGGGVAIGRALALNSTLINLGLNCRSIGAQGSTSIAEGLKRNTCLRYLNLSNNLVTSNGGTALAEMLRVNKTLTMLHLKHSGLCATAGERAISLALTYEPRCAPFCLDGVYLERLVEGTGSDCPLRLEGWLVDLRDRERNTNKLQRLWNYVILEALDASFQRDLLAFAMGTHARLGGLSFLYGIGDNVFGIIAEMYWGKVEQDRVFCPRQEQDCSIRFRGRMRQSSVL